MGGRPRGLNAQGDDTQDFCQLSILSDLQLFISQNPSFISFVLARPLPRYHVDPFREGLDPSRVTWHEESRRKAKLKPKLLQSLIQKRSQSLSHPLPPLSIRDKKPFLKIPIDPPLKIQWFAHQQRKRMRSHCSILWRFRLDPDLHIVALSLRLSWSYTLPKQPDKKSNLCALMQWFPEVILLVTSDTTPSPPETL